MDFDCEKIRRMRALPVQRYVMLIKYYAYSFDGGIGSFDDGT